MILEKSSVQGPTYQTQKPEDFTKSAPMSELSAFAI